MRRLMRAIRRAPGAAAPWAVGVLAAGVVVGGAARPADAGQDEWLQFRGPAAGVVPDDPNLPEVWSETENVVWKTDIPGLAWSSPVITGDHVFVTTAISAGDEPDPIKGLYDPGMENGSEATSNEHRWVLYDIDFHTGTSAGRASSTGRPRRGSGISRTRSPPRPRSPTAAASTSTSAPSDSSRRST